MLRKSMLKILLMSVNFEKFTSVNLWLTEDRAFCFRIERLKCCVWYPHKFIEVNFSKLRDSHQIFGIDFVSIYYHLCEISRQIIECNFFCFR